MANREPTGAIFLGTLSPQQGRVLTATSTIRDKDGIPDDAITFRWQSSADGTTWVDIAGATGASFSPGEAQVGSMLRLVASYTDDEGAAESVTSVPTRVVGNRFDGAAGDESLKGTDGTDFFAGLGGEDTLNGGDGVDTASYAEKTASVMVTLNGGVKASVMVGDVAEDTIRDIENVRGGSGDDTFIGDDRANVFKGGLGEDTLNGGAGRDAASYSEKTAAIAVTLNGGTGASVTVGGVAEDTIRNIENVRGGSAGDTLTGDGQRNVFRGGLGNDTLDGGSGRDTASYSEKTAAVAVTLNGAADATVTVGGAAEDTVGNIENVRGGSGNDTLTGDGQGNLFKGGLGTDTLDGGRGQDTASYSEKNASVEVTLNGAADAAVRVAGVVEDTIRNFENINGGSGDDKLTGDASANIFQGAAGADRIEGGAGADELHLGSDDDRDTVVYSAAVDSGASAATWDQVFQFEPSSGAADTTSDMIDLSALDADAAAGDQTLRFVPAFTAATGSQSDGQVRIVDRGVHVKVEIDLDGDNMADMVIQVRDVASLGQGDLIL